MWDLKAMTEQAKKLFSEKKQGGWLLIIGLTGMALILLSEIFPDKTVSSVCVEETLSQYVSELEEKLGRMVGKMEGTGDVLVMVTLENGRESVFASDFSESEEVHEESVSGEALRQQTREYEESILVSGSDGAVIRTYREPKVSGVVVVCEGGDDPTVCTRVTMAVSTVLGVSSNRVYVTR